MDNSYYVLSDADSDKLQSWLENIVYANGQPYEGAIGGAVTYSFTPTSIGMVVKVHAHGHELDLSDYASW